MVWHVHVGHIGVLFKQSRKVMGQAKALASLYVQVKTLLEILGFATEIQLHATRAIANLCSYIRQVAHDI